MYVVSRCEVSHFCENGYSKQVMRKKYQVRMMPGLGNASNDGDFRRKKNFRLGYPTALVRLTLGC